MENGKVPIPNTSVTILGNYLEKVKPFVLSMLIYLMHMFSLMTDHFSYTDKVKRKLSEVSGRINGEQENIPSTKVIISKWVQQLTLEGVFSCLLPDFQHTKKRKDFNTTGGSYKQNYEVQKAREPH